MKTKLTIATMAFGINTFAQAPTILWQKTLGGSDYDFAESIQQTKDGGFIVAGFSYSNDGDITGNHGGDDYWIVKLNNKGVLEWQKSLGGSGSDEASSIQQTFDGGYIVAGYSSSTDGDITGNHGQQDFWVVKLNALGTIKWQKSIGGTSYDYAKSIKQTFDGGYIIAGFSNSTDGDIVDHHGFFNNDYLVVKLDSVGAIQWQKSLGGTYTDNAYSIQQTNDGGYIVAGSSRSEDGDVTGNKGGNDFWVVKLNATGAIIWQKSLGGNSADDASSISQTSDNGYIVAGYSNSTTGDITNHHGAIYIPDYWVVKIDSIGTIQWQNSLGGTGYDMAKSIQQTADGGYIVAGFTYSNDDDITDTCGGEDYWIVKLNSTGSIQWQKSLGGTGADGGEEYNNGIPIIQTIDGGYFVAGYSASNDGNVTGNHGGGDYWVVQLKNSPNNIPDNSNENRFVTYPNPTSNRIIIEIKQILLTSSYLLTDLSGKEILSGMLYNTSTTINIENLYTGIYFLEVRGEHKFCSIIIKY